jgi:secreted Zn-dependent insulinase-like peptidase
MRWLTKEDAQRMEVEIDESRSERIRQNEYISNLIGEKDSNDLIDYLKNLEIVPQLETKIDELVP